MYKIYQRLTETPLPSDWDADTINRSTAFSRILKSILSQAKKLGKGSSRIVFEIEDPGYEDTVIKVALNKKGLSQNSLEAEIINTKWYSEILPDIIDQDRESKMYETNNEPLWIQVKKASKPKPSEVKNFLGIGNIDSLRIYLNKIFGRGNIHISDNSAEDIEILNESEWVQKLTSMIGDYDLAWQDLYIMRNLGFIDGELKIIDAGASNQIIRTYYSR